MSRVPRPAFAMTALSCVLLGLAHLSQGVEGKDGCMQRALEALLSDWMGVLSGLRRLWEADEVTSLITSAGEENPPHTPLAALIDVGDLRGLVAQLTQSWQAAFAQVEDFRQVRTGADDTQLCCHQQNMRSWSSSLLGMSWDCPLSAACSATIKYL